MTGVEFHFNAPDKVAYACRFARKALRHGARLVIVAPAAQHAALDKALWNLAPSDFLAHCAADADEELRAASPIVVASPQGPWPHHDVLLNLGADVPVQFDRFARLVEVVSAQDEQDRTLARQRWRHYAGLGYAIARRDLVLRGD